MASITALEDASDGEEDSNGTGSESDIDSMSNGKAKEKVKLKLPFFRSDLGPVEITDSEEDVEQEHLEEEEPLTTSTVSDVDMEFESLFVTPKKEQPELDDWSPPSLKTILHNIKPSESTSTPSRPSKKQQRSHLPPPKSHSTITKISIQKEKEKSERQRKKERKKERKGKGKGKELEPEPELNPSVKPAPKRKRGQPSKSAENALMQREDISGQSEPEISATVPTKRARGRPKKIEPTFEEPMVLSVAMYTEVEMPKVPQAGKTLKGLKMVAQDNITDGPRILELDANWGTFIDLVSATARCRKDQLVLGSFRWAWKTLKGTSKAKNPITTVMGYEQMIKNLKAMSTKERDGGNIYIYMAPPVQTVSNDSRPWNTDAGSAAVTRTDSDIDHLLGSYIGQKKSVDERLRPIIQEIEAKYPKGSCREHPEMHCFKYEPKQWHFNLDGNRTRVFAMAVFKKEVKGDLTEIPLTSAHFKQDQTIGYHSRRPQDVLLNQSTPGPLQPYGLGYPPMHPYPPAYPFSAPGFPSPYPSPYYPGYATSPGPVSYAPPSSSGNTNTHRQAAPTSPMLQNERYEPRSSPPLESCDLQAWCESMGLNDVIYDGLVKMHFQVGDNIGATPESEWKDAGLKWLDWERVKRACNRYKRSVKNA